MCNQPAVQTGFTQDSYATCLYLLCCSIFDLRKSLEGVKLSQILWDLFSERESCFSPAQLTVFDLGQQNHLPSHKHAVSSLLLRQIFFESPLVPLTTSGFFVMPLLIFHYFKPPVCRQEEKTPGFLGPLSQTISISTTNFHKVPLVCKEWGEALVSSIRNTFERDFLKIKESHNSMKSTRAHQLHTDSAKLSKSSIAVCGKVQPRNTCTPLGNAIDFPPKVYGSFIHVGMY